MTNLSWTIGDITVTRVEEAITAAPAVALMPDYTPEHLDGHRDWMVPRFFSENDEIMLSVHSFVVESRGRTIVVDTCVGPDGEHLPTDLEFPNRLAAAIDGGLNAVDIVLCTHMHFDHVGWNTIQVDGTYVPTFPNARYLFAQAEMDHLRTDEPASLTDPWLLPLTDAGLVDLVESHHQLTEDVQLIPTPGHTPGHVSVVLESQGQRALITGDMIHTPLQMAHPDLPARAFDWDSEMSCATRHQIIDTYADTDVLILGTHFAPPTAGHMKRTPDGVWFAT